MYTTVNTVALIQYVQHVCDRVISNIIIQLSISKGKEVGN